MLNPRQVLLIFVYLGALLMVFFVANFMLHPQELSSLVENNALRTSTISSGSAFVQQPQNFIKMFFSSFVNGRSNLMLGILVLLSVLITSSIVRNSQSKLFHRESLLIFPLFFLGYMFIAAFRSGGSRHIYLVLPVFFLWACFLMSVITRKKFSNLFSLFKISFLIYLLVYIFIHTAFTSRYIVNNASQWQTYQKYNQDLQSIIKNDGAVVLTTYEFAWTLPNNPKLYLEVNLFNPPTSEDQMLNLLEENKVEYVLVDERSRIRMIGIDEYGSGQGWYLYWDRILQRDYQMVGVVYNKYYRHNKGLRPENELGFKTEIWKKTLL